jgi:hypothetical protein
MESAKEEIWLILRAQAGDREAFDRLFRLLQEPLYRYIFSLTGARAGRRHPPGGLHSHISENPLAARA